MALSDQDGHTHSHLRPEQRNLEQSGMPDRGHWVGPRPGDPLPQERPKSTLPPLRERIFSAARTEEESPFPDDPARSREVCKRHIRNLLENQPMVESQRRILIQALGVLGSLG